MNTMNNNPPQFDGNTYCVIVRDSRFPAIYATFATSSGAGLCASMLQEKGCAATRGKDRGKLRMPKFVEWRAIPTTCFRAADYQMTPAEIQLAIAE